MGADMIVTGSPDIIDVAALEVDCPERTCVVCGREVADAGSCCSSRCAGEAQRQLRRNAAQLNRLALRDAPERRHQLAERNGRLMSAILRWRPEAVVGPDAG